MSKIAFLACCLSCVVNAQSADDYKDFQKSVEQIISQSREVAVTDQERSDLRILQWNLQELKRLVAKGDWTGANHLKKKMQSSLQRSSTVSADAPRRKAERERAEKERQHRELMKQNARNHQQLMNQQQQLLNEIRLQKMIDQSRR